MKKLSYANVVATLALIVAVGTGGAWAAGQIDGSTLRDRSVGGGKLKNDTVKGKQVKESTLKGLVRGTRKAGRTTATGTNSGDDQGEVRSLRTPIGRFRLACGIAAADTRYYNNTPGTADVFQSTVGSNTETFHDTLSSPGDIGFAADETTGPELVELRVSKGKRVAIFRASEAREGTRCTWIWELVSSG